MPGEEDGAIRMDAYPFLLGLVGFRGAGIWIFLYFSPSFGVPSFEGDSSREGHDVCVCFLVTRCRFTLSWEFAEEITQCMRGVCMEIGDGSSDLYTPVNMSVQCGGEVTIVIIVEQSFLILATSTALLARYLSTGCRFQRGKAVLSD
ncbi:hypothetical protein B0H65DRAFT_213377 [Neurospora tetraspora]|uniref:Uncharacterized protein n=1 Tax=Neurospora tetraspora TaxID=94610 RepID=A0AAE0JHH1_9PEZI|nr:hypothetical protein B0H65DRAFT_213377 [Neurospora tetraspora]